MNNISKLTFITSSKDKLRETKLFLDSKLTFEINLVNASLDLYEIQGTSEEILLRKIQQAVEQVEGPVLVEDSALSVFGMDNLPGPYIKDFLMKLGNRKLFQLFSNFSNKEDKYHAVDKSFIALHCNNKKFENPVIFKGETYGKIVEPENEPNDEYNWCFFFVPEEKTIPYGKMTVDEKNSVSARRKALNSLCDFLESNKNILFS